MDTYYTIENFFLYFLLVLFLLIFVPLAVMAGEGRRSVFLKSALGSLAMAVSLYPLSRTCPYEELSHWLLQGSLLSLLAGIIIFSMAVYHFIKQGRTGLFHLTEWEADRWITRTLEGSYLVLDTGGSLIRGSLKKLPPLVQPQSSSFKAYLDSLTHYVEEPFQMDRLYHSHEKGISSEGILEVDGRCYKWFYTPLGESSIVGYLFSVLDITEEYELLEERKKQEKLLEVRVERIREQGKIKAREERVRIKTQGVLQSTEIIKNRLQKLLHTLKKLEITRGTVSTEIILQAVKSGEETMESIRSTVHGMGDLERNES
jgi:hypothetical protein